MTRYEHCGAAIALPTAPAWSFGTRHHPGDPPPGPGTGKYPGAADTWAAGTAPFGRAPPPQDRPSQFSSAPYTGGRYLRPDYLSQNPKGPAWGFGQRTGKPENGNPGVGFYSPRTDTFQFPKQQHAVWGPPPRRPPSAPTRPRPLAPIDRHAPKPKPVSALPGATFKGKYQPAPLTDSPGPCYYPCCGEHCCDMCEKYKGISFGIKHHIHEEPPVPPPDYYHMGCSTLGAAAAGCISPSRSRSHTHLHASSGLDTASRYDHTLPHSNHLRRPTRRDYEHFSAGLRQ
ncbi:hypothetical protein Agub_g11904 [Astrephomene gubernaculifera]|uniref:Uncharacterized protein n=1 Tax=Astrephomene gubernaculifera TaxID=47775 RepID=A0AAD3HR06_9CHLO|nr:hypothetical protein Agub_g11904 [Astrephomene gubernaculifera]